MPRKRTNQIPATPLARRLDAAAERAGLTNEAIAAALKVSTGNVSHWRVGRHAPDVETILRYARLVGASDYELLTGRPDPGVVIARLRAAREGFREAVLSGVDPASAWETLLGQPGLLTDEERAGLSEEADDLRGFLATADGLEWVAVDEEQRRVLRDLLRLFARDSPPTGQRHNLDPSLAPAEKSE